MCLAKTDPEWVSGFEVHQQAMEKYVWVLLWNKTAM